MTVSVLTPEALTDPDLHAAGEAHDVWRWMRVNAPVYRHEAAELPAFWSVTRYEDIRAVYRDPQVFSSRRGVLLRPSEFGEDPGGGMTLALTDPPRHKQLRGLVADWFTARSVRSLEVLMERAVHATLAHAAELGECDFVQDVAGRFSMAVIGHVIGVPEADHDALFRWTNEAFEAHVSLAAHQELMRYFIDLMDARIAEPTDDLVSMLVCGEIDGEPLTDEEILLNCENLLGATENGRLALAGGMQAFLENPGEWEQLRADRRTLPGAVEEILRWTSSAVHSMRTATRPTRIGDTEIEAGDRVVVWVPSANRDEDVFVDPYSFDITRSPNRHIALGGGEHFCLGGGMARAELRILFDALATHARVEQTGPADRVRSLAVSGPEQLPVRITLR